MPAHTPLEKWQASGHTEKRKKNQTQPKQKGQRGRRPRGPRLGQAAANTTEPRHDLEQHPPPAARKKKERSGRNPAHGHPRTTPRHRQPHQAVAGNGQGAPKRAHAPTPQPEKQGAGKAPTHTHAPRTPARNGRAQPKPVTKHTRPRPQPGVAGLPRIPAPNVPDHEPQPEMAGQSRTPSSNRRTLDPSQEWRSHRGTQTQTETPHNNRKPSLHSPGTEAARAMQVNGPNEIRRPEVRLHLKASAALGLEAERATPKHLGTPVPRTCMHALGTAYARKSGEPLGFRLKEGRYVSMGAHPPGETSTSRWRRSALPVMPGAALLGATSQV